MTKVYLRQRETIVMSRRGEMHQPDWGYFVKIDDVDGPRYIEIVSPPHGAEIIDQRGKE